MLIRESRETLRDRDKFMKIVVLLKKTPDTEAKIKVSSDGKSIDHSATKYIMNPYDLHAI